MTNPWVPALRTSCARRRMPNEAGRSSRDRDTEELAPATPPRGDRVGGLHPPPPARGRPDHPRPASRRWAAQPIPMSCDTLFVFLKPDTVPATKKVALTRPDGRQHQLSAASFCEHCERTSDVGPPGGRISPHREPVIAGLLAHWPPRRLTVELSTGVRLHAAARSSGMCGCWRRLRPPTDGQSGKSEVPHGQGPGCGDGAVAVGAVETSIPSALRAATRLPQRLGTFVNRLWEPHCLSVTASRRTCRGSSSSGLRRQRW